MWLGAKVSSTFSLIKEAEALFSEISAGTCRSLQRRLGCSFGLLVSCVNQSRWSNCAFSSHKGCELWDLRTARRLLAWPLGECLVSFDAAGRLLIGSYQGIFRF